MLIVCIIICIIQFNVFCFIWVYFISTYILLYIYLYNLYPLLYIYVFFIKSILEFHFISLADILLYFCVGMGSQELWATMCTLDFPVLGHSCRPVPRCLRALLLMPSEGLSLCLLWLLEYISHHSTYIIRPTIQSPFRNFFLQTQTPCRAPLVSFTVYLEACFSTAIAPGCSAQLSTSSFMCLHSSRFHFPG